MSKAHGQSPVHLHGQSATAPGERAQSSGWGNSDELAATALDGQASLLALPFLAGCGARVDEDEAQLMEIVEQAKADGLTTEFIEEAFAENDVLIGSNNTTAYFDFGYPNWKDRRSMKIGEHDQTIGVLAHESTHDYVLRNLKREDVKAVVEQTAGSFEGQSFVPRNSDDSGGTIHGEGAYDATQEALASYAQHLTEAQNSAVSNTRWLVDEFKKDSDVPAFEAGIGEIRRQYREAVSSAGQPGAISGKGSVPELPEEARTWVRETLLGGDLPAYESLPGVKRELDRAKELRLGECQ